MDKKSITWLQAVLNRGIFLFCPKFRFVQSAVLWDLGMALAVLWVGELALHLHLQTSAIAHQNVHPPPPAIHAHDKLNRITQTKRQSALGTAGIMWRHYSPSLTEKPSPGTEKVRDSNILLELLAWKRLGMYTFMHTHWKCTWGTWGSIILHTLMSARGKQENGSIVLTSVRYCFLGSKKGRIS